MYERGEDCAAPKPELPKTPKPPGTTRPLLACDLNFLLIFGQPKGDIYEHSTRRLPAGLLTFDDDASEQIDH